MWQTSDSGEACHKCNAQRCLLLMALHICGIIFGVLCIYFLGSSHSRHTIESSRPKRTARYANHGREIVIRAQNIVAMVVKTINLFILTCLNTITLH